MNAIFKAQINCNQQNLDSQTFSPERKDDSDWILPHRVEQAILNQNSAVSARQFDPIHYFGGYTPAEVGTGIIRKVMVDVFAPEPRMHNLNPSEPEGYQKSLSATSTEGILAKAKMQKYMHKPK